MEWLTALIAFAVTMLIFSIIVSTLVETIHRFGGLRGAALRRMLERLYINAIEPRLDEKARPDVKGFVALIVENRAAPPATEPASGWRTPLSWPRRLLHWMDNSSEISDLPVEVFTQKLADSRIVGATVLTDDSVKDIAQKFEAFGKEASTYFERRARLLSVFVAIFVAFMFYIHPYNLAITYIRNPELAQSVADKAADVQAEYAVLMEKLNSVATTSNPDDRARLEAAIKELTDKIETARQTTMQLQASGVPVGWPQMPNDLAACGWGNVVSNCQLSVYGNSLNKPSLGTALWLLLGGLLVGLGAPFWQQSISTLTSAKDVTGKIAAIVTPARAATTVRTKANLAATVATPPEEATAVASFRLARGPK